MSQPKAKPVATDANLQPATLIERAIVQLCQQYLDVHYQRLGVLVLSQLCQVNGLRLSGKAEGWAGGILWALFEHNFGHAAPDSISGLLCQVMRVNISTLRKRRHEVVDALNMDHPSLAADYMHPAVYDMLNQLAYDEGLIDDATPDERIAVQLILPDLAPEAQQALVTAFQAKLDVMIQHDGFDLAQMTALAKTFGITVERERLLDAEDMPPIRLS